MPQLELTAQDIVPPKIVGIVKKLDAENGTITVRSNRKGVTDDETFSLLRRDIDVTTATGEKTKLEAVLPGYTVHLKMTPRGEVEAISIQPHVFLATVTEIDPKKRTVTFEREPKKPATLPVAPNAPVLLAGRTVYLREVKPGSQMNVSSSLDGKAVTGLTLVTDPDGKLATKLYPRIKSTKLPGVRWMGAVADVSLTKNELQFVGPKTKGVPRSLPLAKDALIQVLYGEIAMQDIPLNKVVKDTAATVLISADEQITRVLIRPPVVRAMIKKLDGEAGTLTVELDGRDKTFPLLAGFKVMWGTRVMRLADLETRLPVSLVLALDREQLLGVDLR